MKVYTYQSKEQLNKLLTTGELKITKDDFKYTMAYDDLGSSFNNHFKDSYDFMWEVMNERLGKCMDEEVIYPIWVWYRYRGRRMPTKCHDKEELKCAKKNHINIYRIDLDVEKKDILLSDFDMWHVLLNGGVVKEFENDCDEDPLYFKLQTLPYNSSEYKEIKKYLNCKIFNYNHKEDGYAYFKSASNTVQGCLYKITLKQVINIEKIYDITD